jgi:hypothetical protein
MDASALALDPRQGYRECRVPVPLDTVSTIRHWGLTQVGRARADKKRSARNLCDTVQTPVMRHCVWSSSRPTVDGLRYLLLDGFVAGHETRIRQGCVRYRVPLRHIFFAVSTFWLVAVKGSRSDGSASTGTSAYFRPADRANCTPAAKFTTPCANTRYTNLYPQCRTVIMMPARRRARQCCVCRPLSDGTTKSEAEPIVAVSNLVLM